MPTFMAIVAMVMMAMMAMMVTVLMIVVVVPIPARTAVQILVLIQFLVMPEMALRGSYASWKSE
jgi:hypothetical protein